MLGRSIALTAVCVAIFAGCVFLYTRHNDFPLSFQPDESLKVEQLLTNTRSYSHPQLLLESTQLAWRGGDGASDKAMIARIGRTISAAFAALAVVTFALAAYRFSGWPALLLSALSIGLCPSLLIHAHYFKEDTALVFGIALVIFAVLRHEQSPSRRAEIFLGIAVAFAASAKYVGIIALPAVLLFLFRARSTSTPRRFSMAIVASFVLTFIAINYRIFEAPIGFIREFFDETRHSVSDHRGLTMSRPNLFFVKALVRETMPHALLLAVAFTCFFRESALSKNFVGLFALAWLVVVSFCVIPEYRYNLPLIAIIHFMAALGIVDLARFSGENWKWAIVPAAALFITALQLPRCQNFLHQFADDSRARLRAYVAEHVPAGSVIIADRYTALKDKDDARLDDPELPAKVQSKFWAADFGELQSFRGVDYVAVSELAYGRLFDPDIHPRSSQAAACEQRRRFYRQLFEEAELVWSSTPKPPSHSFVNPPLRLYRLRAAR